MNLTSLILLSVKILILYPYFQASGQTDPSMEKTSESAHTLPPITVTASQSIRDIAPSTILTKEEVAESGKPFLRQILEKSPGVTVTDQTTPSVRLRGSAPRHSPLLMDGLSTLDGSSIDGSFDFNTLSSTSLNRVTILRGPQSVYYGDGAVSGIIDIEQQTEDREPGTSAALHSEYGSFFTRRTLGRVHHVNNRSAIDFAAQDFACDGPSYRKNFGHSLLSTGTQFQASDHLTLSAHVRGQRTKGNLLLGHNNTFTIHQLFLNQKSVFTNRSKRIHQSIMFGYNTTHRSYTAGPKNDHFNGNTTQLLYRGRYAITQKATLQWGADGRFHKGQIHSKGTPHFGHTMSLFGVYSKGTYALTPALKIEGGVRLDTHNHYADLWNTQASLSYAFPQTSVFASYGTGYKTPSLYQLFDPQYGNQHLRREQSIGIEAGIIHKAFQDKVALEGTFFNTYLKNFIDFKWSPTGKSQYTQHGDLRLRGIELSLSAYPSSTIDVTATYTFTHTKGASFTPVPQHLGTLMLTWSATQNLTVSPSYRLSSKTNTSLGPVAAFGIADINTRYSLSHWTTLTCRIDNILNKHHAYVPGQLAPGISAYTGLEITL